ncbi:MAG: phosphomannomutase/phosphoglucomutase [Phycisphaerae bacterium]|nr:phosphomannomutase/phosphoglucomutase [Phycisphaerae bacterium]|tara:strand:- start:1968 stop:3350 length:1383 start_codon:yes stop_codon:yes gene_type:complete
MLASVFKAYDVRAVHPDPLSVDVARSIGCGAGEFFRERVGERDAPVRIAVGHDMRLSSPELVLALEDGLRSRGCDVVHVGLVDTPFVAFAVNHLECDGGIQTTASHNPAHYNGFKICAAHAKPVGEDTGLRRIRELAELGDHPPVEHVGERTDVDLWDAYREHVFRYLDPGFLDGTRRLKVAIDASNGMAGTMIPRLFDDVPGIELVRINFENESGVFVHEPNPLVEANLQPVRDAVRSEGADLGICFDGDADRCMVVDERGGIIGCDLLTAWLSRRFIVDEPGASIVYDLRSSHCVQEAVRAAGGEPVRSRVGHVFMKQKLAECSAPFGGELSGHFYFRDNWYADSGAMAFALVLTELVSAEQPLSRLIEPMRGYVQSGEINFQVEDKAAAMERLKSAYPDAEVDELDGVTVQLSDWWCNVRASNTEPLLRLNLEGPDAAFVQKQVEAVSSLLGTRVDH